MADWRNWLKSKFGRTGLRAARLFEAANQACDQEEYVSAFSLFTECLDLMRELQRWDIVLWIRLRLGWLAQTLGDYPAARLHLEQAVSLARNSKAKLELGHALSGLAAVAARQGEYSLARRLCAECLRQHDAPEDAVIRAGASSVLGSCAESIEEARRHFEEALAIVREHGDQSAITNALCSLGHCTGPNEDNSLARQSLESCLEISEFSGTARTRSYVLNNLGNVERFDGNLDVAAELYRQSLHLKQNNGDEWGIAYTLEGFAAIAAARKQGDTAARLLGAAEAIRARLGAPLEPMKQPEYRAAVQAVRELLAPEDFEFAWNRGKALPVADAIALTAQV